MRLYYWRGGRTMSCGGETLLVLTLSVVILLGQLTAVTYATTLEEAVPTTTTSTTHHQTPPNRPPKKVIDAFETSLLKMFGLSSRPRPSRKVHIPQFMLDLYHNRASIAAADSDNYYHDTDSHHYDDNYHATNTYLANTIRSYPHSEEEESLRHQGDLSDDIHHQRRFYFNISNLPADEVLRMAELRLYRQTFSEVTQPNVDTQSKSAHQQHNKTTKQNSVIDADRDSILNTPKLQRTRASKKYSKQRIDIYEVIRPATRTREAITTLLDTRVIDPSQTSWETFDIRPAVLKWRETPQHNHGLEVHVRSHNGDALSTPAATNADSHVPHVRLRRSLMDTSATQWALKQPLIVTYTEDNGGNIDGDKAKSRSKRRARHRKRSRSYQKRYQNNECRRHNLYVDFGDVGWDDWIVAPTGYDAFYCHGECGFPLPEHMNTTNHAIVQTLVHSVNPRQVPRPCCVPTDLSSISMLYLDESDKVVLKNYQDMVVVGCGCR